jgi:hypothetical protein
VVRWSCLKGRKRPRCQTSPESATSVLLASVPLGTVAWWAGPYPFRAPAPGTGTLPPLPLGGMGGGALRGNLGGCTVLNLYEST